MKTEKRRDLYAQVTASIIEELERGVRPWSKQWVSTTPRFRPLRSTGERYRGINTLLLWGSASRRGFRSPYWFTYRQASELGGQVRRGEKGTEVVYFSTFSKSEEEKKTEEEGKAIPFLKTYSVFNATQIENLPEQYFPPPKNPRTPTFDSSPIDEIECFFRKAGVEVENGGDVPHYSPRYDRVQMPPISAFRTSEDYYAVLCHEAIHWTGHPSRLPRKFPGRANGTKNYAREELVAELGAAFLCADLGLTMEPRPDHATYIEAWLDVLRNDKRAIFQAASMAEKATEYLHLLQSPEREIPPKEIRWSS